MTTQILFLILLIELNAFFSSSEIALISLNDNKIKIKQNYKKNDPELSGSDLLNKLEIFQNILYNNT